MPTDVFLSAPNQKSRFNVSSFITQIRSKLQLTSSNRITDTDIINWLGEASDEIAIATHWYRTQSYLSVTAGTKEYDLPANCLMIEECWWDVLRRKLIPLTPPDLEGLAFYAPDWRFAADGIPVYYYVNSNSALGFHPTPNATTSNAAFIVYTSIPARPASTSDFVYHPPGCEMACIDYCCWQSDLKDLYGEGQKRAPIHEKAWLDGLERVKRQIEALYSDDLTIFGEYATPLTTRWRPRSDWENGQAIPAPS